jgi:hypothetical protein
MDDYSMCLDEAAVLVCDLVEAILFYGGCKKRNSTDIMQEYLSFLQQTTIETNVSFVPCWMDVECGLRGPVSSSPQQLFPYLFVGVSVNLHRAVLTFYFFVLKERVFSLAVTVFVLSQFHIHQYRTVFPFYSYIFLSDSLSTCIELYLRSIFLC